MSVSHMTQYSLLALFIEYIAGGEMPAELGVNERDKRPIRGPFFLLGCLQPFICPIVHISLPIMRNLERLMVKLAQNK